MVKKNAKYHELDLEQSKLKSVLHEDMRKYLAYRRGRTIKAPITMAELEKQEKEINKIRKQLEKTPSRLMRDLRKTLKNL